MVDIQPAGLGVRAAQGILATLLLALGAATSLAQSESQLREGELSIDIDVRFVSTYRDGSWVPIDIVVNNNKRDIEGYLEVLAISAGVTQPPVYRVQVDSPKGSRKRFRLYCLLDGTTDLEAMLYRGRRPALSGPMKIALRPIAKNDYLCLILDNEPADYGFLYNAVLDDASDQGFYRIELRGDELSALPDRLACYEPIDLVVIGDINPADISLRHRTFLRRYVENGGTLIVCGGANTSLQRGTWVEELAGVTMGPQQIVTEAEFAALALRSPTSDRIRADKQGEFTPLTPNANDLLRWGGQETLATLRPIGNGFAGVVSLDMAGKLLHTTGEYAALWRQLAGLRASKPDINVGMAGNYLRAQLPNIAGVRVFPRSSVAAYLTLYLLVAIIGNWVFWSFMKRRELAWVCLVFFSFGFTAYAMVYGTAGRAKETELEQVNLLRVYRHTPVAKMDSTIGLLSARSARYSFELADAFGLVSQGAYNVSGMYPGMRRQSDRGTSATFAFVEGSQPRVEDLRVGASVMRTLQVESEFTLNGGFEGTLTHDANGLHGTLINRSGLHLQKPYIYYQGRMIRAKLKPGTDEIEVKLSPAKFDAPQLTTLDDNVDIYFGGYQPYGTQSVESTIRAPIATFVFVSPDGMTQLDPALGPYVYGWATDSPPSAVELEEDAKLKVRETFVVADISVEGEGVKTVSSPLAIEVDGQSKDAFQRAMYYRDWNSRSFTLNWEPRIGQTNSSLPVVMDLPSDVAGQAVGPLTLELCWVSEREQPVYFTPDDAPSDWTKANSEWEKPVNQEMFGTNVKVMRYRVDDWRTYYDERDGVIRGRVAMMPDREAQRQRSAWSQFTLRARLELSSERVHAKEWTAWP